MIELKKQFKKRGVVYTQIFKDEELVIYELSEASIDDPSEIIRWYEIFKPVIHNANQYHSDDFELYPYDEAFGFWAWDCSNESVVAKVIYDHFKNHRFAKEVIKYADGSYTVNGVKKPYFKLTFQNLKDILSLQ